MKIKFNPFKKKNINLDNLNSLNTNFKYTYTEQKITKYYYDFNIFDVELYVISILETINVNLIPNILHIEHNDKETYIEFDTKNLTSLKHILENSHTNFYLILNEFLSFIQLIKTNKILIPNLHIEHIYINLETLDFYILDLSKATFTDSNNITFNSLLSSLSTIKNSNKIISYLGSI